MGYKVLQKSTYTLDSYTILPFREEDLYLIKKWRNEQMDVLRQKELLTDADQERYFNNCIKQSFSADNPKVILFSFLKDDRCIGYGGLTNIDWESERIELSFLLETERAREEKIYSNDFLIYLELIKEIVFKDMGFHRIFTETFDIRPLHIKLLEKSGFLFEGRMKDHVLISEKYVDSILHGLINHNELE